MKIDVRATQNAIIEKATSSRTMSIDVKEFRKKITSKEDLEEACKFVRVEPIYK